MWTDLEQQPDGWWKCPRCGGLSSRNRHLFCLAAPPLPDPVAAFDEACQRLGITTKAKHYAQALLRWAAAGFPTRPQDEIDRIWRECCEPCKHRDKNTNECRKCGCPVKRRGFAVKSKLRMATESCPVGKFPAYNSTASV